MTVITTKFDPWGPISTVLYEINSSDFVLDAIGNTGIHVEWHPLTIAEKATHTTRIRAFRQDIANAYTKLDDADKGQFTQIVVKAMLGRHDGSDIRSKLIN